MTKRRRAKDLLTLEAVITAIAQLNRSEKEELLIILQAMLEAEENEQATGSKPLKARLQHRGPKGGKGYYERKTINGCGPYLYLRYWSGGKHRSVYLGKVPPTNTNNV